MKKTVHETMSVNWPRLWQIAGKDHWIVLRSMCFKVLQSFSLGVSFCTALWVIRELAIGRALTQEWLWQITFIAMGSLAGQLLFSFLSVNDAWQVSFRISGKVRLALLNHLLSLPLGYHLTRERGDVVNLLTTDVEAFGSFLSDGLAKMVQAIALPFAILLFMAFHDLAITGAIALTIFFAIPVLKIFSRKMASLGILRQTCQGATSARIIEFVNGQQVLRAFGQKEKGHARFQSALNALYDLSLELVRALVMPAILAIIVLVLGIPVTFMAVSWSLDTLSVGTAISAVVLGYIIYGPIINLINATELIRIAEASMSRVDKVFDRRPPEGPQKEVVPQTYMLKAENISFGYDDAGEVLQDINFEIPQRSMTAIVGPSGSGKSTLMHLIARFWDVRSGGLSIGGVSYSHISHDNLMDYISLVSQDVTLFKGSIYENIALGCRHVSKAEVIEAAKLAQADHFISALPEGYETEIDENGISLSGGERQRIAIARAILRKAPIILLDEATAAIDPTNERALQKTLDQLVDKRTVIVVAHKLKTIQRADQILVLDQGRLVEQGKHEELMRAAGLYADLFKRGSEADSWYLSN